MTQTATDTRAPEYIIQDEINDFEIWCHKYWRILHEDTRVYAPFIWKPIQRKVAGDFGKLNVFCKPRKVGGTTLGMAKIAHQAFTQRNSLSFVIANNEDLALAILQRIVLSHKHMPDAVQIGDVKVPVKPKLYRDNASKGHIVFCWDWQKGKDAQVFSTIEAGTANGKWSVGRGSHPDMVLFTEAGMPEYHDNLTFNAVMSSIRKHTVVIMESSPYGAGGPMWEKFQGASWKNFMPGGGGKSNDWVAHFPTFKDEPTYVMEPARGEDVNPQNEFEEELIERYSCTVKQMLFARWTVRNAMANDPATNPYDYFHQEFPVDPIRCWLVRGDKFFDSQMLASRMERSQVYCLDKTNTTFRHPKYVPLALHRRRMKVSYAGRAFINEASAGAWQILETPKAEKAEIGNFNVYGKVHKSKSYLVTADPAAGGDDSAIMIFDKTALGPDKAIALFKDKISIPDFARNCFAAWEWYGKPLFMHENNNHGHALTLQLLNLGMPESAFFRMQKYDRNSRSRDFVDGFGFNTNAVTKPRMLNLLYEMLQTEFEDENNENGLWIPFADFWIQAMNFVSDKGKLKGTGHTADDLVICAAMAAYAMYNERAVRAPQLEADIDWHELKEGQLVPSHMMKGIDLDKITGIKRSGVGRLS